MATNYIPVGVIAATGAEITLAVGDAKTLSIIDAAGPAVPTVFAQIQYKGSNNQWFNLGRLDNNNLMQVLQGAGTYRVIKPASPRGAYGVDAT